MKTPEAPSALMRFLLPALALALTVWQPIGASAQERFDLPIRKIDCTTAPGGAEVRDFTLLGEVPGGCSLAAGVSFTVTAEDGSTLGSCTLGADGICTVAVPIGETVTVTEDVSTAAAGFAPRENPVTVAVEPNTEASAIFVNLREPQLPATGSGSAAAQHPIAAHLVLVAGLVCASAAAWLGRPQLRHRWAGPTTGRERRNG